MSDFITSAIDIYRATGNTFYLLLGAVIITIPIYFFFIKIGKDAFSLFGYKRKKLMNSMHAALDSEYVDGSFKTLIKDEVEIEHLRRIFGKFLNKDQQGLVLEIYTKIKDKMNPKKVARASGFMVYKDKKADIEFGLLDKTVFWYVILAATMELAGAILFGITLIYEQDNLSSDRIFVFAFLAISLYLGALFMLSLNNDYWVAKRIKKLLKQLNSEKELDTKPEP